MAPRGGSDDYPESMFLATNERNKNQAKTVSTHLNCIHEVVLMGIHNPEIRKKYGKKKDLGTN